MSLPLGVTTPRLHVTTTRLHVTRHRRKSLRGASTPGGICPNTSRAALHVDMWQSLHVSLSVFDFLWSGQKVLWVYLFGLDSSVRRNSTFQCNSTGHRSRPAGGQPARRYKCKHVVRSSLADETQAYVETLDMLEFTKVFHALFLDPWKSLRRVPRSQMPRVCTVLWRGVNHQHGTWLRDALPWKSLTWIQLFRLVNSDRQMADGLTKPQAAWKLLEIMSAGRWKVGGDATFQSARKLKLAERSEGKRDSDG